MYWQQIICYAVFAYNCRIKIPPTIAGRWDLQLDINVDGQILPLVAAEVLAVSLSIFQSLIETDGKLEI